MDTTRTRCSPLAEGLMIAGFAIAICLPVLAMVLAPEGRDTAPAAEKGKPAATPTLPAALAGLQRYPAEFSSYFRDHFGLRSALIRAHARVAYGLFHVSPSRFVLTGREGWLYYADDSSLEDYRSLTPLAPEVLGQWKRVLEERQAWLARRGIRFLVVLCCDKHIVYPEYLPAGIERRTAPYRVEQMARFLSTQTTVPVVSFKAELEAAKQDGRIYHRTDSHWNDAGAYVGYRAIATRLGEWFPGIRPLPPDAFTLREADTPGWDLAVMMGLQDRVREVDRRLVPKAPPPFRVSEVDRPDARWNSGRIVTETDDDSLPRAVIFRDSFGSALVPFLAGHFRRCEFLWQYEFETRRVRDPKPDVVILLITSRRLQWYVPENPPLS